MDATIMATTAALSMGKYIGKDFIGNWIKSIVDKRKISKEYGDKLISYLENYYEKFSKVKTILHGSNPIMLKDIYYPLKAKGYYKEKDIEIHDYKTLLADDTPKCITIIGDAGSGKTTFTKNLFLELIENKEKVPFYIELRRIEKKESIETYLFTQLCQGNDRIKENLHDEFDKGHMVVFLDGYDEVKRESKDRLLSDFIDKYPKNKYILTSRPSSGAQYVERFEKFSLCELEGNDVEKFAKKQLSVMGEDERDIEEGLLESLKNGKNNPTIQSFLVNPLLLSIYINTYKHSPEIPNKKSMFYQRAFEALFDLHDSTSKGDYKREKKCKLDRNGYEEILQHFSDKTYWEEYFTWKREELERILTDIFTDIFENQYNIKSGDFIQDMLSNISIWTEDEGEYSFVHRSFQEYFATHYIKNAGNKKAIYSKIRKDIIHRIRRREITNILDLLEEIDEKKHREYLLLPILKKTKKRLRNDCSSFIQEHIKYMIPLATPKQFANRIINHLQNKGYTITKRMEMEMERGIERGIERGMRMRRGRDMEMDMDMESGMIMEMIMRMDMEMIMRMDMEMEIGEKMEMRKEIREKMEMEIREKMEMEIREKMEMEIREKMDYSLLKRKDICICTGFNFLLTSDLPIVSIGTPYIKGEKITELFFSIQESYKEKVFYEFIEKESKNKRLIAFDEIPKEIKDLWVNKIKNEYEAYKTSIDERIDEVEKLINRRKKSEQSRLARM